MVQRVLALEFDDRTLSRPARSCKIRVQFGPLSPRSFKSPSRSILSSNLPCAAPLAQFQQFSSPQFQQSSSSRESANLCLSLRWLDYCSRSIHLTCAQLCDDFAVAYVSLAHAPSWACQRFNEECRYCFRNSPKHTINVCPRRDEVRDTVKKRRGLRHAQELRGPQQQARAAETASRVNRKLDSASTLTLSQLPNFLRTSVLGSCAQVCEQRGHLPGVCVTFFCGYERRPEVLFADLLLYASYDSRITAISHRLQ